MEQETLSDDAPHLLLVDDDASIRTMLEEFLSRRGYKVTTAADGAAALELLQRDHFDLLLSDVKMPELDGIELLKEMGRSLSESPAAVLMTGYSSKETTRSARELGAYDCLSKPFRLTDVERVLGQALSEASAEPERSTDEVLQRDL